MKNIKIQTVDNQMQNAVRPRGGDKIKDCGFMGVYENTRQVIPFPKIEPLTCKIITDTFKNLFK